MAHTLEELADRCDLQDLVTRYATGIDARDMVLLDTVFTPDAHVSYEASGGPGGPWPEIREWLATTLPIFAATQHLMANLAVTVDGDTASGRCMCFNPMALDLGADDGSRHVMFYGLWYVLDWVRTSEGWRLSRLRQEKAYDHNVPSA